LSESVLIFARLLDQQIKDHAPKKRGRPRKDAAA
jgi:hypothetical protein